MQDLGRGITLEIVDMLHQVNGLGGGYPGDWTCYPKYRDWEVVSRRTLWS